MRVCVDQSRENHLSRQVDPNGVLRNLEVTPDRLDLAGFDQDRLIGFLFACLGVDDRSGDYGSNLALASCSPKEQDESRKDASATAASSQTLHVAFLVWDSPRYSRRGPLRHRLAIHRCGAGLVSHAQADCY